MLTFKQQIGPPHDVNHTKRKRIEKESTLAVEDGLPLTTLKEFTARGDGKKRVYADGSEFTRRRCGHCGKAGRNIRTCK